MGFRLPGFRRLSYGASQASTKEMDVQKGYLLHKHQDDPLQHKCTFEDQANEIPLQKKRLGLEILMFMYV